MDNVSRYQSVCSSLVESHGTDYIPTVCWQERLPTARRMIYPAVLCKVKHLIRCVRKYRPSCLPLEACIYRKIRCEIFEFIYKKHLRIFLERASRSALTKYTIKSLVYVSTTNIYLEYIGYMFRPVNRSSSGHQSNKSKVLLRYSDPNIYNYIQYKSWYWLKYIVKLILIWQYVYICYMFRPVNRSKHVACML